MTNIIKGKNSILICICVILSVFSVSHCIAEDIKQIYAEKAAFKVQVNNEEKDINSDILVVDGVSYVPLREFSNMLGSSVKWDEANQLIDITSDFVYTQAPLKFYDETNEKYGYKDNKGNIVIEAKYDDASEFAEGAAIVLSLNDAEYIFINQSGDELFRIDAEYNSISLKQGFSEGCCAVSTFKHKVGTAAEDFPTITYVDTMGNKVMDKEFKEYSRNFHEGYAVSLKGEAYYFTFESPILSYIDKTGNFATDTEYSEAGDFIDGYAKVTTTDGVKGKIDRNFTFYPDI